VPVEVATYLLNEKRPAILEIEDRQQIDIVLIPNPNIQTPKYKMQRVREDDKKELASNKASYQLITSPQEPALENYSTPPQPGPQEEPAVKGVVYTPPPVLAPKQVKREAGFIKRLWSKLFRKGHSPKTSAPRPPTQKSRRGKSATKQKRSRSSSKAPTQSTDTSDLSAETSKKTDNGSRSSTYVRQRRRRKRSDANSAEPSQTT